MSHQSFRINLSAYSYPFATELWGRSIIVPQIDENYEVTLASKADISKDKGIPQAYYMHNVMPTAQGYQSISYDKIAEPITTGAVDFNAAFPIQNSNGNRFVFVPANGQNYIYDQEQGGWLSFPFSAGDISPINPPLVTTAFVNGQSYIFYEGYGCFVYNDAAVSFDTVALAGLSIPDITGICAANGYMIAFAKDAHPAILYSNSSDPTDFAPSLITGAGSTDVQAIAGKISVCLPIAGGFMIYCTKNVVSATYTNNAEVPFNFNEVQGSGGVTDPEQVSWQANLGTHFVWSAYGCQEMGLSGGATNAFPELTDFLAGKLFEDFNEVTLTFSQTYLTTPLKTRLTIIENSFMVLSYGIASPTFTHAIVMDMNLQRFGKFKINHVDCFQWNDPGSTGFIGWGQLGRQSWESLTTLRWVDLVAVPPDPSSARTTLAFLQDDGTVKKVNFDLSEVNNSGDEANGVLLLGKFQLSRNKFITHQWTDVENVQNGLNFEMYLIPTLDGKTLLPAVTPHLNRVSPNARRYGCLLTGQNVSMLFTGAFNLTTVIMDFTLAGDW